jgi:hypothetical protein
MNLDIKHFILSHLVWIVLAVSGVIGWHYWLQEHDARVAADNAIKVQEATVKSLQQQIVDRDAQAAKQQQVIVKVVHDTVTPAQAVQNLPQVVTAPLPAPVTATPMGDMLIPQPDVMPIFQQLADDKICRSQLDTCTQDLNDTKAIVAAKDTEIVALKKKPTFWHRIGHDLKVLAIGAGVTALVIH